MRPNTHKNRKHWLLNSVMLLSVTLAGSLHASWFSRSKPLPAYRYVEDEGESDIAAETPKEQIQAALIKKFVEPAPSEVLSWITKNKIEDSLVRYGAPDLNVAIAIMLQAARELRAKAISRPVSDSLSLAASDIEKFGLSLSNAAKSIIENEGEQVNTLAQISLINRKLDALLANTNIKAITDGTITYYFSDKKRGKDIVVAFMIWLNVIKSIDTVGKTLTWLNNAVLEAFNR